MTYQARPVARPLLVGLILLLAGPPAAAEGMMWDFGLQPRLDAAMTAGENAPVHTDEQPDSVYTLFVLQGSGKEDWTESFAVLNTKPKNEPKSAKLWYERLRESADASCPSEWLELEKSSNSMTFERRSPECAPHASQTALYRVLYGRNNVFVLSATVKGEMSEENRKAWLALLASAKLLR